MTSTHDWSRNPRLGYSGAWAVNRRPPKVLVVDDEEDVQALIADVLTTAGVRVVTASTGWDAFKILEDDGFDLVVADVVLPDDLSGLELVTYVRARQPALKALFVSGHSAPVEDDPDLDDFVAKPFHPRELLGCVYELLGRQRPEKQAPAPHRDALLSVVDAKMLRARRQSENSSAVRR